MRTVFRKWCVGIIWPILKQGDVSDSSNYRGITLLNIVGEICTKLLSNRLVFWANVNHKLFEEQCGYREGYFTVDNKFTLQAFVNKYLSKRKERMYCMCIDFSKAFDCVQHKLLMYVLLKNGEGCRFRRILKSMYSKDILMY
jgi:hypothetical protein